MQEVKMDCMGDSAELNSPLPSRGSEFTRKWIDLYLLIACIAIGIMLCLSLVDIVGSKLDHPLSGALDMIGFVGIVLSAFALSFSYAGDRHIRVDIIVTRLPKEAQVILNAISTFLTLLVSMLLIAASIMYALELQTNTVKSMTLETPLFPFAYILAFAFIPFFWLVFRELINTLREGRNK